MNNCIRFVLGVALLLSGARTTYASTCFAEIVCWPADSLPLNGRIVLQETSSDLNILEEMITLNPRLVADGHTIPLIVGRHYEGHMNVSQLVLIPNAPLTPNTTYRLRIDSMQRFFDVFTYGWGPRRKRLLGGVGDTASFEWTTTERSDDSPPVWITPTLTTDYSRELSPLWFWEWATQIQLITDISDEHQTLLEVSVRRTDDSGPTLRCLLLPKLYATRETGKTFSMIVSCKGRTVECDFPAVIDEGQAYRVTYTAIDVAGNRSQGPSDCTISFVNDGKFVRGISTGCTGAPTPPVQQVPPEIGVE